MERLLRSHFRGPTTDDILVRNDPSWSISQMGMFLWVVLFFVFSPEITVILLSALLIASLMNLLPSAVALLRRKKPVDSPQLLDILERAKNEIGYNGNISLWRKKGIDSLIVSASTLLYRCILLSAESIRRILQNPTYGEVVIAWEVAKIRNTNSLLRFIAGIGFFIAATIGELGFIYFLFTPYIDLILAFILNPIVVLVLSWPWGVFLILRRYTNGRSERLVEKAYRIHPRRASVEVFAHPETKARAKEEFLQKHRKDDDNTLEVSHISLGIISSMLIGFLVAWVFHVYGFDEVFIQTASIVLTGATFGLMMLGSTTRANIEGIPRAIPEREVWDDEKAKDVGHIIERELGNPVLIYAIPEVEDFVFIEVKDSSDNRVANIMGCEWTELDKPGLIAAYLVGERRRGLATKKIDRFFEYSLFLGIIGIILIGITELYVLSPIPFALTVTTLFVWLAVMCLTLVGFLQRRKTLQSRSDLLMAKENPEFIEAIRTLSTMKYAGRPAGGVYQRRLKLFDGNRNA